MNHLEELLALMAAGDAEAVASFLAGLTPDELTALEASAEAAAEERAPNAADATVAAELVQIADAVEAVRSDGLRRSTEAATNQAEADAALARIRGEQAPPDDGETGDGSEETPAEQPAEPVAPGDEVLAEPEPEAAATQQPIAASAPAPRLSRVSARRPAAMTVAPPAPAVPDPENWGLVASANVNGFTPGEALDDPEKIARAFEQAISSTRGFKGPGRMKVSIARRGDQNPANIGYDDDRILGRDAVTNARKLRRLASPAAITAAARSNSLTASGGICAPPEVRYDLPVIGTDERPVRDQAMQRFGADRGGVTTMPIPVLSEVEGAVDVWTNDNDISPSDPVTKPCLEVTCPSEDTSTIEAITRCLQFGNFRAIFYPEQIAAWMELAATWHARFAETRLLTTIGAGSTQVTFGGGSEAIGLGATPEVLAYLDRAGVVIRSSNRLPRDFPLLFAFPFWLLDMMRTDIARQLPSGSTDERYAVAEATILGFMRARNITPVPFLDGIAGQVFQPQGDGPLNGWPDTVVTYLYPVGTWLFLDGGTLDLGIVRDSTLNSTNDVQMFMETFEQAHFHGVVSYEGTLDLCPSGGTAATVDTTDLCGSFS